MKNISGDSCPDTVQLVAAFQAAESFDFAKQNSTPHKLKDIKSRRQQNSTRERGTFMSVDFASTSLLRVILLIIISVIQNRIVCA